MTDAEDPPARGGAGRRAPGSAETNPARERQQQAAERLASQVQAIRQRADDKLAADQQAAADLRADAAVAAAATAAKEARTRRPSPMRGGARQSGQTGQLTGDQPEPDAPRITSGPAAPRSTGPTVSGRAVESPSIDAEPVRPAPAPVRLQTARSTEPLRTAAVPTQELSTEVVPARAAEVQDAPPQKLPPQKLPPQKLPDSGVTRPKVPAPGAQRSAVQSEGVSAGHFPTVPAARLPAVSSTTKPPAAESDQPTEKIPSRTQRDTRPDTRPGRTAVASTEVLTGAEPAGFALPAERSLADPPLVSTSASAASTDGMTEREAATAARRAARARRRVERQEVRRFTRTARRRRITLLVMAGLATAVVVLLCVASFSPLFALRSVEVAGTTRLSATEVEAALSGQLGTPLPMVDHERIGVELASFPMIRSYVLESRLPDTLVVRVVERIPVGTVKTATGFELVDESGVTVQTTQARVPGFPVISLAGSDRSAVAFTAASSVLAAMPAELLAQVDSISATSVDDVALQLSAGQRVIWGSAAGSATKASHLTALLAQHPIAVTEYDVSSPGVGIIR